MSQKEIVLKELKQLPGVGKSIAQDLYDLGIKSIEQLGTCDPGILYAQLCTLRGCYIDRCVLYVFRCAVHYAIYGDQGDPRLMKWWFWKD